MLAKRIIPCLDCDLAVPNGRVVKGVKFKQIDGLEKELSGLQKADKKQNDLIAKLEKRIKRLERSLADKCRCKCKK